MKQITYNAQTKETIIIEVPDVQPIDLVKNEPSMEERLASVESTQSQVIDVLAEITGVTL